MKAIDFLTALYLLMLLLATLSGIIRFKSMDIASRIISILIFLSFLTEIIAYYSARMFHTNIAVYTVFSLFEFLLTSLYFNYSIDIFYKNRIGVYIGLSGLLLGLLNIIFFQPINQIDSYFLFFEAITTIAMCFTFLARLMMLHDQLKIHKYHHFWFVVIITFYWCSTFLNFSLHKYIVFDLKKNAWILDALNLVENIVTYLSIAIVFLLYPKMQRQDE